MVYSVICSNSAPNFKAIVRVRVILKSVEEEMEEICMENKTNFEGVYFGNGLVDSA